MNTFTLNYDSFHKDLECTNLHYKKNPSCAIPFTSASILISFYLMSILIVFFIFICYIYIFFTFLIYFKFHCTMCNDNKKILILQSAVQSVFWVPGPVDACVRLT